MPEDHQADKSPSLPAAPRNHVVVYSGGMDSFTLLHYVLKHHAKPQNDDRVYTISFDYGQRHRRELAEVRNTVRLLRGTKFLAGFHIADLGVLGELSPHSALTDHDQPMPHGHYAAENMKQTVVPGRNTVMLSLALAYAESLSPDRATTVYYGAHAGDHHIYPDCRPGFVNLMGHVMHAASEGRVSLAAPFLHSTKGGILGIGLRLGLDPQAYADTWTCYEGAAHPCGQCGACQERAEAFAENGVADPLITAKVAAEMQEKPA